MDFQLTYDLADFPSDTLATYGLEAQYPVEFFARLIYLNDHVVLTAVRKMRANHRAAPVRAEDPIARLEAREFIETSAFLRRALGSYEDGKARAVRARTARSTPPRARICSSARRVNAAARPVGTLAQPFAPKASNALIPTAAARASGPAGRSARTAHNCRASSTMATTVSPSSTTEGEPSR